MKDYLGKKCYQVNELIQQDWRNTNLFNVQEASC